MVVDHEVYKPVGVLTSVHALSASEISEQFEVDGQNYLGPALS